MSSIKSGITNRSSIEKVPDKGWKNVFIKGLKVASSWGRPVQENPDQYTLPSQLSIFSLEEGKSQTRASPQKNDAQMLEAGSNKVSTKKDNTRQAAKALATGPTGGPKPIQGSSTDGIPSRKSSPLPKGIMKIMQSPTPVVTSTSLQIRRSRGFISPPKQRVSGDLPRGIGSSVFSVDEQPSNSIRGHSGPLELDKQAPGIGRVRKADDQFVKVDGVAPSTGWDVDSGLPNTDTWDNLDEGWDTHPLTKGKWVPLPHRKCTKVADSFDSLGKLGIAGSRLFPSIVSPLSGRAQSEYTNDDGWETVSRAKMKDSPRKKNLNSLKTGKMRLNRAILQDSSGTTTSRSRAVEDFELMGKRLGGFSNIARSQEEFGGRSKELRISSLVPRVTHKDYDSPGNMNVFQRKGSPCLSLCRQRQLLRSTELVYSIKNHERSPLRDTDGVSKDGTSKTEFKVDNRSMSYQDVSLEQANEVTEKQRCSFSDAVDHESVSSGSVSQIYEDNGDDDDGSNVDDDDDDDDDDGYESDEPEMSRDTEKISAWCRSAWRCKRISNIRKMERAAKREVKELVLWPPIIVIQNTMLDIDDNSKCIGMRNKELLDYFKSYNPKKARQASGPKGHRGMSVLFFEASPAGYLDAMQLDSFFVNSRRSRTNWDDPGKLIFEPGAGGIRILYGYMATHADIEDFNRYNTGRNFIKCNLKPLQEVVLDPMRLLDDQNMKLINLQTKVEKEHNISKTPRESIFVAPCNYQNQEQDLETLQKRAEKQLITNTRQLNDLEDSLRRERSHLEEKVLRKEMEIRKTREAHEESQRQLFRNSGIERSETQNQTRLSNEEQQNQQALMENAISMESQVVGVGLGNALEYEAERLKLIEKHHELRLQFQRQHIEAAMALEKQLKAEVELLMTTYQDKWLCF